MGRNKKRIMLSVLAVLVLSIGLTACSKAKRSGVDTSSLDGYQFNPDNDGYFEGGSYIAKGTNGYYYIDGSFINYYDNQKQTNVKLCSKANCNHNNSECMAYAMDIYSIYTYNGYIYCVTAEENQSNTYSLLRMDIDGGNRSVIGRMEAAGSVPSLVFAGNYAYYTPSDSKADDTEQKSVIIRINLTDGSTENVYETSGVNVTIASLKSYGEQVYFLIKKIEVNEKGEHSLKGDGLFVIDSSTNESRKLLDQSIQSYSFDKESNSLYYFIIEDGAYRYKFDDKSNTEIFKADDQSRVCDISYSDGKLFINNLVWSALVRLMKLDIDVAPKMWVYDTDGKLICEKDISGINFIYYGDNDRMFAKGKSGWMFLKKDGVENNDWTGIDGTTASRDVNTENKSTEAVAKEKVDSLDVSFSYTEKSANFRFQFNLDKKLLDGTEGNTIRITGNNAEIIKKTTITASELNALRADIGAYTQFLKENVTGMTGIQGNSEGSVYYTGCGTSLVTSGEINDGDIAIYVSRTDGVSKNSNNFEKFKGEFDNILSGITISISSKNADGTEQVKEYIIKGEISDKQNQLKVDIYLK